MLFDSSNALQELIVAAVRAAPGSSTALDAVRAGVTAGSSLLEERRELNLLEERREFNRLRSAVISADVGLQERELFKMAALAAAAAAALRDRGVPQPQASLAAETGVAAFRIAFEQWIGDPQAAPHRRRRHHVRRAHAHGRRHPLPRSRSETRRWAVARSRITPANAYVAAST